MANPHEVSVTLRDDRGMTGDHDATLGSALERVLEAQQDLVLRRATLLIEEMIAKASSFVSRSLLAAVGTLLAIAGWLFAMVGVIGALDAYFARYAVELAVGGIHIAAGAALILARQFRSRAST